MSAYSSNPPDSPPWSPPPLLFVEPPPHSPGGGGHKIGQWFFYTADVSHGDNDGDGILRLKLNTDDDSEYLNGAQLNGFMLKAY